MPTNDNLSVTSHGSFSTHQADRGSYVEQQLIETHQIHSLDGSNQYAALTTLHPTANSTATSFDLTNTFQETMQFVCDHTSIQPAVIPAWLQPFREWLLTHQRQMMSVQGLGDPLLCPSIWVRVFGHWLLRQLLSSQGFSNPLHSWNDVFDIWVQHILQPNTPLLDTFFAHTPLSTRITAVSTSLPTTPQTPDLDTSHFVPSAGRGRTRIRDAVSSLTPQEIQEACRRNGAEESVIDRIAVVFPDVVSRANLMLLRAPGSSARGTMRHRGYMEFVGRGESVKGKGGRRTLLIGSVTTASSAGLRDFPAGGIQRISWAMSGICTVSFTTMVSFSSF
jgi:hypothetical protein